MEERMNCKTHFPKALRIALVIGTMLGVVGSPMAAPEVVLYGGLGGHGISAGPSASTNDGALAIVSQTDGSITIVGHPAGVSRISGLAFGLDGALYAATQVAGGFPPPPGPTSTSNLIRIDSATGALISSVPITSGGQQINIADLAVQPGTGVLFGIRGPNDQLNQQGRLYTIDATTGSATFVGDTGAFFGSIAFASDGALYMSWADVSSAGATNPSLRTLDPSSARALTLVPTSEYFPALAVRPTDGVIFGGTGDKHKLFTINPATGVGVLVGDTGLDFVGDLAFRVLPETANYQGLWWADPPESESGWGINFNHQGNIIFATWFTYDLTGAPTWLVVSATSTPEDSNTFTGTLVSGTGPPFNAFDPAQVMSVVKGTATFAFTDANTATFSYTVDGISQAKTITREIFAATVPSCTFGGQPDFAAATNYQDLWWNAPPNSEPGWGINLTHQGDIIYATWFTFGLDGRVLWMVVAATKTAPNVYSGTLVQPTGGPPFSAVPFDPSQVTGIVVGTATLTFSDGNDATFAYEVNGIAQVKNITRETIVPPGTLCQ
jgi:hypothetical protein